MHGYLTTIPIWHDNSGENFGLHLSAYLAQRKDMVTFRLQTEEMPSAIEIMRIEELIRSFSKVGAKEKSPGK